ncbi:MAG TPA: hypothetical protein VMZ27_17670 [Candidatus Saccharimonadales bacterium]|nr:hypothetical protein [Candidatus Saccharimonadales bacterium]
MNIDPLTMALREIAETRALLECLITSSEGFDYPKAKVALAGLDKKIRELTRIQSRLQEIHRERDPLLVMPDFRRAARSTKQRPRA